MAEKKKTMTKDEIIMELIKLLKENDKQKQAADVFEFATYVDMMENKLDQMTNELTQMRKELQEIKEQQISKSLKETLSDMANRIQVRCQQMKNQLFEVKAEMRNKAFEIVKTTKQMGKEALNKVSEFLGVKKKLMSVKEHVKEGINETEAQIPEGGAGVPLVAVCKNQGQTNERKGTISTAPPSVPLT